MKLEDTVFGGNQFQWIIQKKNNNNNTDCRPFVVFNLFIKRSRIYYFGLLISFWLGNVNSKSYTGRVFSGIIFFQFGPFDDGMITYRLKYPCGREASVIITRHRSNGHEITRVFVRQRWERKRHSQYTPYFGANILYGNASCCFYY